MKGLGIILIWLLLFSVVVTGFGDTCETDYGNSPMSFHQIDNESHNGSGSPLQNDEHCLIHCSHNVSFPVLIHSFYFLKITYSVEIIASSIHGNPGEHDGLFRPPIV